MNLEYANTLSVLLTKRKLIKMTEDTIKCDMKSN